ncbi:uncharacterized protein ACWYII_017500 [Salvelinus alpinus]
MAYFPDSAFWSEDPSLLTSSEDEESDSRYRITHQQNVTKRYGNARRSNKDFWTWEEILSGRGPWAQTGEYRCSRERSEAATAQERWFKEAARRRGWKPEIQARNRNYEGTRLARMPEKPVSNSQKFLGGGLKGSGPRAGRRPAPTSQANRGEREYGQTPCYAVERTVSPVRVHSPVRVIPPPRTGRARLGIEPGVMRPAQRVWSPVRLLGPAYMAPALRMVSPVRLHSPVRVIPPPRTGRATGSIQPGKVGQAQCSREPVRLHGPVFPAPPPRPSLVPTVPTLRTRLPVHFQSPVPPPRTLPIVRVSSSVPPVPAPRTKPPVRLLSPVHTVTSPRTSPEVRALSQVPPVPVPRTRYRVRFESSVCPVPAPRTSRKVLIISTVPPVPAPRTRSTVRRIRPEPSVSPAPSEPSVSPAPSEPSVSPAPSEPSVSPALSEPSVSPAPSEPSVSPAPSEPSVCQEPAKPPVCHEPAKPPVCHEPTEPSARQEPLEPSARQEPLEPPARQDLQEFLLAQGCWCTRMDLDMAHQHFYCFPDLGLLC